MSFTEERVRKVAKELGLSEKFVRRAVGPIRVTSRADDEGDGVEFDIGLRLQSESETKTKLSSNAGSATSLRDALLEYQRCCPAVVGWIASGNFNPDKIPATITRSNILHACRTAGRIRAKFFRKSTQ